MRSDGPRNSVTNCRAIAWILSTSPDPRSITYTRPAPSSKPMVGVAVPSPLSVEGRPLRVVGRLTSETEAICCGLSSSSSSKSSLRKCGTKFPSLSRTTASICRRRTSLRNVGTCGAEFCASSTTAIAIATAAVRTTRIVPLIFLGLLSVLDHERGNGRPGVHQLQPQLLLEQFLERSGPVPGDLSPDFQAHVVSPFKAGLVDKHRPHHGAGHL